MRALLLVIALAGCKADKPASQGDRGTYEDWDSYDDERVYVKDPVFSHDREAGTVRIEADGYFPTIVTVNPEAREPFAARGMLLSRIARFYETLRIVWDPTTALVEVEVRRAGDGEPIDGVTVNVNAAPGFRRNWNGGWSPSRVTGERSTYLAFPNVAVGGGWASLQVKVAGATCKAPSTIKVEAGAVAFVQVVCTRR